MGVSFRQQEFDNLQDETDTVSGSECYYSSEINSKDSTGPLVVD